MSSNFGSSKEAKISRQMNRSQKLNRKNTCKRHIQLHRRHPGLKNEAETKNELAEATSHVIGPS